MLPLFQTRQRRRRVEGAHPQLSSRRATLRSRPHPHPRTHLRPGSRARARARACVCVLPRVMSESVSPPSSCRWRAGQSFGWFVPVLHFFSYRDSVYCFGFFGRLWASSCWQTLCLKAGKPKGFNTKPDVYIYLCNLLMYSPQKRVM